ncbi:periplasmic nitrate reductase maturation protein NapF [Oleiphilus messinensis]|uniref:Ferredoxin-type protein NapF n=2 Tax=Oleiphilus messinensis TaxID=141451 RepID=A0A1Y0I401_9GAMM|nr:periplasmic nitrate reductase maturation protein NapF [Oleiphilus messinensis]
MSVAITRRNLLRAKINPKQALLPPWAMTEQADGFFSRCTRCSECIQSCPESILEKGDGGFPRVNFRLGECTFCGLCEAQCPSGALDRRQGSEPGTQCQPWDYVAEIQSQCLNLQGVVCQRCADPCESRAIHFTPRIGGPALPGIEPDLCTGCGACVSSCPVDAIEIKADQYSQ